MRRGTNSGLRLVLVAWLALPLAGVAASGPAKVDVRFGTPGHFAENRGKSYVSKQQQAWLTELGIYIQRTVAAGLTDSERAEIDVRDLKFSGSVESWRGLAASGLRVVRDTTPPRMLVAFRVLDGEGRLLRSGERSLRDINFVVGSGSGSDALRYEKALVDDWVDQDFPVKR